MNAIERRDFLKGSATGVFAFTVGGVDVLLSAREAHAQNIPFRLLKTNEAETIEALGETLVPGARAAGIAHFIDQQLSVPPEEALNLYYIYCPALHTISTSTPRPRWFGR